MDGILIVNKPQGMTSHDVVAFIRKHFMLKKVGHAGTLDPMATGVLVVLINGYTKSSAILMASDKEYEATLMLGAKSDTADAWGHITYSGFNMNFTDEQIGKVFDQFIGEIEQCPPMYSAVKHCGRKLYEFARKGQDVRRESRKVKIKKIEILSVSLPHVSFKVTCSKGTYVRQLASDIGDALGCGAYLSGLKRTRSGDFTIGEALSVEELKSMGTDELGKRLIHL